MNKQEQIEAMAKIIDELYNVYDTTAGEIAEGLYSAGYRKEQETAKEILNKLNALMEQYHYKSTAWRNCANFIKETYDVEVEE